jgi:histidinol-phosphatase (PHP family)
VHRGGGFVLSDDSHGVEQVATNYSRVLPSIEAAGIQHLYVLQHVKATNGEAREAKFEFMRVNLDDVKAMSFWNNV